MFKWMARWFISRFESRYRYDASYLREVLEQGGIRLLVPSQQIARAGSLQREAPVELFHAARLAAAMHGGCGPCLQLCAQFAEEAGMDLDQIRAVLRADVASMSGQSRRGCEFARLVLAEQQVGELRAELERQFGAAAVIEMAYAVATADFYPKFKRALGHAAACFPVRVGNGTVDPRPLPA